MRKAVLYTWVAAGAAVLYLGWVAAARFAANRRFERAVQARQARPRESYPSAGTEVKILQFYANTGELIEGAHAVVCYGVENARTVRIEPPVERLRPAMNRCFAVEPEETTTYTLRADGFDGAQVSASFTVKVNPVPPAILFIATSENRIRRGQPFTICYGVKHTLSARLEPIGLSLAPSAKNCVRMFPVHTTDFTFVAKGVDGKTDREKFKVMVH